MMRGGTCFCDFVAVLSASSALLMGSSASTTPSPCGFSPCPSWEPTWNITQSTIIMPCNYSGYFDYTIAGRFAVVDYDWSNAKEMWANPQRWPGGGLASDGKMDCQERLLEQARMTKAHARSLGIEQKVWVYRNLVKALPWYSSVRALLNDSAYSGFFLKFDSAKKPYHVPQCDSVGRCSTYYHDQTQSPQSGANCSCTNCGCCVDGACDVGTQPCGEYLWNHANGSQLREWLVNEYVGGAAGLGSPNIDGLFLDDGWGSSGPSEVESHSVADMGLSPSQLRDIRGNWSETCRGMSQNPYPGAFGNANAGGMGPAVCKAFLRKACAPHSAMETAVNIFTFTRNPPLPGQKWPTPFPLRHAKQDVAMFLLSRGKYAYIGYGWQGCQCLATDKYDHCLPHNLTYEFPELLERDYGSPTDGQQCSEIAPGVFSRNWTKAVVTMDCNTWSATLEMK